MIGFGGSFTGERRKTLDRGIDVDAHLTQKKPQNKNSGLQKPKKLSKSERAAENMARENYRDADKTVTVEQRVAGKIISRRTIERS